MTNDAVVLGIDGGGSYTRVMVSDLNGSVLSYVEGGASSINKDNDAINNVRQTIQRAIAESGFGLSQVKGICAGIAGFDSEQDLEWVEALTDIEGLSCPKWHVNDAVIAHAGAFLEQPGVVVVSGTGSIIFAITEDGTQIRNYDFHHYAASAARFLSYDAVYEALAGNHNSSDEPLLREMVRYWSVDNLEQLRHLAVRGFIEDRKERDKMFGRMAHLITEAACDGSSLAQLVCDRAIHQVIVGVELLGSCFQKEHVAVSGIGSVIKSPYMKSALERKLAEGKNKKYQVIEPELTAVAGAVVMALHRLQIAVHPGMIRNLRLSPHSTY